MLVFYVSMLYTDDQKDKFAEDALQELIKDMDSIHTYNTKQLAYYLCMIALNRTVDFMRKRDRRSVVSHDVVELKSSSQHEDSTDIFLTKLRLERILKKLYENRLPIALL